MYQLKVINCSDVKDILMGHISVSNIWVPDVDVPGDTSDPPVVFVGNNHKIFGEVFVNLEVFIN